MDPGLNPVFDSALTQRCGFSTLTVTGLIVLTCWWLWNLRTRNDEKSAPLAPGLYLPFLGHALSYKADPPGFLKSELLRFNAACDFVT